MMGISKDETFPKKRRKVKITFNEDEEVINPEDIDPSVGRFRNMVTTTVIPNRSFSFTTSQKRFSFQRFPMYPSKYRYLYWGNCDQALSRLKQVQRSGSVKFWYSSGSANP